MGWCFWDPRDRLVPVGTKSALSSFGAGDGQCAVPLLLALPVMASER